EARSTVDGLKAVNRQLRQDILPKVEAQAVFYFSCCRLPGWCRHPPLYLTLCLSVCLSVSLPLSADLGVLFCSLSAAVAEQLNGIFALFSLRVIVCAWYGHPTRELVAVFPLVYCRFWDITAENDWGAAVSKTIKQAPRNHRGTGCARYFPLSVVPCLLYVVVGV
ncbi:unnamed protein product, partial [Pylaiella littoralis]